MTMTLSGDGTITGLVAGGLPDATIVQADLASNVVGTGPAFSAYLSATQSISTGTYTKLQFNSTSFDVTSSFNTSTYRFTAPVAGIYQINVRVGIGGNSSIYPAIYKNGGAVLYGVASILVSTVDDASVLSGLFSLAVNDYIEIYAYTNSTNSVTNTAAGSHFSGFLARKA